MAEGSDKQAATAAYRHDDRGGDWQGGAVADSDWHPAINRLLAKGHIFLGYGFSSNGLLFRGMPAGISKALHEDCFWHSDAANPLCQLERELDVIFCSEVARDGLAVARPWESGHDDAAVLVFDSDRFNERWQQRNAAMLGFADVGMVFKYPSLTTPLAARDLLAVIMHPDQQPLCPTTAANGPALLSPADPGSRDAWQAVLDDWLGGQARQSATAVATDDYPRPH